MVVGVGDMKVGNRRGDIIITYALGSCIGIVVYDPVVYVGGMLHVMLPDSSINPGKARLNPFLFVDSGLPEFFHECYRLGARKERVMIKAAGGASCSRTSAQKGNIFQIGRRNFLTVSKLLRKNGLQLGSYDIGGTAARTMALNLGNGEVTIKSNGELSNL